MAIPRTLRHQGPGSAEEWGQRGTEVTEPLFGLHLLWFDHSLHLPPYMPSFGEKSNIAIINFWGGLSLSSSQQTLDQNRAKKFAPK